MIATAEVQVEIDDALKRDEQLFEAVESASELFRKAVDSQPELVHGDGMLRWKLGSYSPGDRRIVREYSEPNPDGTQRIIRAELVPSALLDPVHRDVSMLRLLSSISRWRLDEVNASITEHLRELDSEE